MRLLGGEDQVCERVTDFGGDVQIARDELRDQREKGFRIAPGLLGKIVPATHIRERALDESFDLARKSITSTFRPALAGIPESCSTWSGHCILSLICGQDAPVRRGDLNPARFSLE